MPASCRQCGCALFRRHPDPVVGRFLCDPCGQESLYCFATLKAQHEDLLERGVHPRIAERIMQRLVSDA